MGRIKMDIRNCPRCGKVFAYTGNSRLCPVCRNQEEDKFQKVKEYLWEHPNATIEMVHEETKVERELIIKFVREDRLLAEGITLDLDLKCERCGKSIKSGRFCKNCQDELLQGLKGKDKKDDKKEEANRKIDELEIKKKGKMYTANRIKRRNR